MKLLTSLPSLPAVLSEFQFPQCAPSFFTFARATIDIVQRFVWCFRVQSEPGVSTLWLLSDCVVSMQRFMQIKTRVHTFRQFLLERLSRCYMKRDSSRRAL